MGGKGVFVLVEVDYVVFDLVKINKEVIFNFSRGGFL